MLRNPKIGISKGYTMQKFMEAVATLVGPDPLSTRVAAAVASLGEARRRAGIGFDVPEHRARFDALFSDGYAHEHVAHEILSLAWQAHRAQIEHESRP